jgi:hypothetical protein
MTKIMKLTQRGPSREQFFDCVRLGPSHKELRSVEFWGERVAENGSKHGFAIHVEIEGIYRATNDDDGREWFFWGRRAILTPADSLGWQSSMTYIFGRWNTHFRRGQMVVSDEPIFQNPLTPFALLHSNSYEEWNNFDHETEQSVLEVCRSNWNLGLADEVCMQQSIPVVPSAEDGYDFNTFVSKLPNDAYRHKFIVYYLEYLKEKVIGKANCGCVYHAEQGIPCQHDLALLVRRPGTQTEVM